MTSPIPGTKSPQLRNSYDSGSCGLEAVAGTGNQRETVAVVWRGAATGNVGLGNGLVERFWEPAWAYKKPQAFAWGIGMLAEIFCERGVALEPSIRLPAFAGAMEARGIVSYLHGAPIVESGQISW